MFEHVTTVLHRAGHQPAELTFRELAATERLSTTPFDVLLLCDSRRFPAGGGGQLTRFLKRGGHLALLGGYAFSTPIAPVGNQWLTQDELATRLATLRPSRLLFDFDSCGLAGWSRGTSHPKRPSSFRIERNGEGGALRLDIRQYGSWNWDTLQVRVPAPTADRGNVFCIRAKSDDASRTHSLGIVLTEDDGTRWRAKVPLTTTWQWGNIHAHQFQPHDRKLRRAQPDRVLVPERVRNLSIGLAGNDFPHGDHTIHVKAIGWAESTIRTCPPFDCSVDLNVFEPKPANRLDGITRVAAAREQDLVAPDCAVSGAFSGWSAVGYPLANTSEYVPLLGALDKYGRNRGWAGGLLVNYAGEFAGSNWLVFGVEGTEFYMSPAFDQALVSVLKTMRTRDLAAWAREENAKRKSALLSVATPAPSGFVRIGDDGTALLLPDGTPFVMTGANYLGPSNRKCHFGERDFDPVLTETDFRLARDYGVNCLRIWCGYLNKAPGIRETLIELARRYNIRLLVHCDSRHRTVEAVADEMRMFAEAYAGEPMVLGLDLRNEPYIGEIGALTSDGQKSPILQLRPYDRFPDAYDAAAIEKLMKKRPHWPVVAEWLPDDDRRQIYAALHILEGPVGSKRFTLSPEMIARYRSLPESDPWRQVFAAVDETFRLWIEAQVKAIKSVEPRFLVTVGYNTALGALPANALLDIVSHHSYGQSRVKGGRDPDPRFRCRDMENLHRLWPHKPITLGEFGYTTGERVGAGLLSPHDACAGELLHYLTASSLGLSGCMKWCLTDWTVAGTKDMAPWIAPSQRLDNSGYGMFASDGTTTARPKPIAFALRFLAGCLDGQGGTLETWDTAEHVPCGYRYQDETSLIVAERRYTSPALAFSAPHTVVVMCRWTDRSMTVMATADVELAITPSAIAPGWTSRGFEVKDARKPPRVDGGKLELQLLAGEPISIQRRRFPRIRWPFR